MSFKQSRYYGSRVEQAKAAKGWLSNEEFTRLGRQEFQDYRGYRIPVRLSFGKVVGALVVMYILLHIF